MVEVTDQLVRKLSSVQRRKIIEHVPGRLPIIRDAWRHKIKDHLVVDALRRLGLVATIPRNSGFPTHTELTAAGREVAAKILAECAELLVDAGALEVEGFERPLDVLIRLKSGGWFFPDKPGEVAEAEELDEPRKLTL